MLAGNVDHGDSLGAKAPPRVMQDDGQGGIVHQVPHATPHDAGSVVITCLLAQDDAPR
jgi:hypothetical protein